MIIETNEILRLISILRQSAYSYVQIPTTNGDMADTLDHYMRLKTQLKVSQDLIDMMMGDVGELTLSLEETKIERDNWKLEALSARDRDAALIKRLNRIEEAAKAVIAMAKAGGYPNVDELQEGLGE